MIKYDLAFIDISAPGNMRKTFLGDNTEFFFSLELGKSLKRWVADVSELPIMFPRPGCRNILTLVQRPSQGRRISGSSVAPASRTSQPQARHLLLRLCCSWECESPKHILQKLCYCCCRSLCNLMDCMQHNRLPCTSLSPRVCTNSCPLSQ